MSVAPRTPAGAPDVQREAAPPPADTLVPLAELAPALDAARLSRRRFLGFAVTLGAGLAGAGVLSRLVPVFDEPVADAGPITSAYDPGSRAWTFVVDTRACIGCGLCVAACKTENHVPDEPGCNRTWVERHTIASTGERIVDSPDGGIDGFEAEPPLPPGAAADRSWFVPRLCMQCESPPCTTVCPVGATYRTPDGVVLVDAGRCIGCGYCVAACPYGARYLVPAGDESPAGVAGVADKCTWCYHRISRDQRPACVEVCPVGARKFGDRNDPDSEVARIVATERPEAMWPEFGTRPRVLYLGPVTEEA